MKNVIFITVFFFFSSFLFAEEKRKEVGDYNFDGYEDYRVFLMPNGRMILWDYFLFNPKEKKHIKYGALTNLWNPKFDKETKKIFTFAPGGHASVIFTADTYAWKNGDIQLIKSTRQDWDQEKNLYVNTILNKMGGEMRVDKITFLEGDKAKNESLKHAK